jgi:hypothetical protein
MSDDVVPYTPNRYLSSPTWNPFDARIRDRKLSTLFGAMAGTMMGAGTGAMTVLISLLGLKVFGIADIKPDDVSPLFLAPFGAVGTYGGVVWTISNIHKSVTHGAYIRVMNMVYGTDDESLKNDFIHAGSLQDTAYVDGVFRMDSIAHKLSEANGKLSTSPEMIAKARAMALDAARTIIGEMKIVKEREAALLHDESILGELERTIAVATAGPVAAIGDGRGNAPVIGNARIGRLIASAENALRIRPDLADSTGARIDDLVRKHLPRLLQTHQDGVEGAPMERLALLDEQLEQGVEIIRQSIEEAIDIMHDGRMSALQTEIRFLATRRRTTDPLLTSIDHEAGSRA